jgi:hypothetical protein
MTAHANDGMIAQITEQCAHLLDLDSGALSTPAVLPSAAGACRPRVRRAPCQRSSRRAWSHGGRDPFDRAVDLYQPCANCCLRGSSN